MDVGRQGLRGEPTGGLLAEALANLALVLEVNVPALGLPSGVLKGEGKDSVALLDRILLVGGILERLVDGLEGGRGGELVCGRRISIDISTQYPAHSQR